MSSLLGRSAVPTRNLLVTAGKKERQFAPDYVSVQTLAYRLDCSRSTIDDYVRRGLLPRPIRVGRMQRWRWRDIETWIAQAEGQGRDKEEDDPYMRGVDRVTTSGA
jgi:predicted DNA-binding transcriptional regulator AlpA